MVTMSRGAIAPPAFPETNQGAIEMIYNPSEDYGEDDLLEKDVQCTNCALDLRPENALMHDGKPFCDEFCRDHYDEEREVIPLAAGLHHDGTIHIYTDGKDSGMRIEIDADGVLVIHPGDTARWRVAKT